MLLRRGPADLFGGPAARQLPFDTRSKTGVTRELPVGVPARFVLEQNADIVGRARNPGRLSRHQLHRHGFGLAPPAKGEPVPAEPAPKPVGAANATDAAVVKPSSSVVKLRKSFITALNIKEPQKPCGRLR